MTFAARATGVLLAALMVAGCGGLASRTWRAPRVGALPHAQQTKVIRSSVRCPDGSVVTIAEFSGPVRYVLHNGTLDPGPLASKLVREGPSVSPAERGSLLAVFNGGFKMNAKAGGYMQERHVIRPVRNGLASLVIDADGRARIGVWGQTVPLPGESVYSVRQNLWLLVSSGKPTAESRLWWRWGGTVGHHEYVARSALGQTSSGELIYAGSMRTTPGDLAYALIRSGTVRAMEMDINPYWVMLGVARAPGGALAAAVPGQQHPPSVYLTGWYRDFIAVEAAR